MTVTEILKPAVPTTRLELARTIDETKLVFGPEENQEAVIRGLCENAVKETFRSVCVRPEHVKLAKSIVGGTDVMVATVIGFPKAKTPLTEQQTTPTFGNADKSAKMDEMSRTAYEGCDEFDIVMNVGLFKQMFAAGTLSSETFELAPLVKHAGEIPIKLIIETDLLTEAEIEKATELCCELGIAMVKTSTGMLDGGQGATLPNITRIYDTIQKCPTAHKPGIKASGGVRNAQQAIELIKAGTNVLGSSAGTALLNDFEANR